MKWIQFDFHDKFSHPKSRQLIVYRWIDYYGAERFDICTWQESWVKYGRGPRVRDFVGDNVYDIGLDSDRYKKHLESSLLTHWCPLDKPIDNFWRAYKHENGNTYCDKEYVTDPD